MLNRRVWGDGRMSDDIVSLPESASVGLRMRRGSVIEHLEYVAEAVVDDLGVWIRLAPAEAGAPVVELEVESALGLARACAQLPWIIAAAPEVLQ